LDEGIKRLKTFAKTKFDQSVDLVCHLGIDSRQADQMIRGSISLPKGIGVSKKVIAFCNEADAAAAKAAGAMEAGADELVDRVAKGWMDFDVAIAHPALMGKVGKLGRVLGPQARCPRQERHGHAGRRDRGQRVRGGQSRVSQRCRRQRARRSRQAELRRGRSQGQHHGLRRPHPAYEAGDGEGAVFEESGHQRHDDSGGAPGSWRRHAEERA